MGNRLRSVLAVIVLIAVVALIVIGIERIWQT
jgi:hypothetical protein